MKKSILLTLSLAGLALLALPQTGQAFELQEEWVIKGEVLYKDGKIAQFNNGNEVDIKVIDLPKTEKIEWKVTLNGQDQTTTFLGEERGQSMVGAEGRYLNFYVPYGYRGDIQVEAKSGNEVKTWSSKVVDDVYHGGKSSFYNLENVKDEYSVEYTHLDTKWDYQRKTYTAILPNVFRGKKIVAWRENLHDEGLKLEKPGEIVRPYNRGAFTIFSPVVETASWLQSGDDWYYQKQGELVKDDWVKDKGTWYFMNGKGIMFHQTWLRQGETWYAFKPSGAMIASAWLYDNGAWYYLKSSGAMVSEQWLYDQGNWYYLTESGAMKANSWIYDKGEWYYLASSGAMVSHKWVKDNGKWYYLDGSGKMLRNTYTPDGYYVGNSGAWQ